MKKTERKRVVDLALWFLFCFLLGTGLMIHYRLVPGFQGGLGASFLGVSRHGWGNLHFWASCFFTAGVGYHLYLNFNAIKMIVAGKSGLKAAVFLGIGILIILFFLLFPVFQGQGGSGINKSYHQGRKAGW